MPALSLYQNLVKTRQTLRTTGQYRSYYGKIYERLLNERIADFAENNGIHDPNQYGFRSHRGTDRAIAIAYETIANAEVRDGNCTIILRDIEKAFDKVWHSGLRHRMLEVQMPNLLIRCSSHFLESRTATIKERGIVGPPISLLSGVPQGSCLSPTLFIIYTSDTPPPRL